MDNLVGSIVGTSFVIYQRCVSDINWLIRGKLSFPNDARARVSLSLRWEMEDMISAESTDRPQRMTRAKSYKTAD